LYLAHGGRTDFRGEDKTIYNFVTSAGFGLNVKTELADFYLNKLLVHGSFLTEAHVKTHDATLSYWAYKIGFPLIVWVNGTCKEEPFKFGPKRNLQCGKTTITTAYKSATVETDDWKIQIRPNQVYGHVSGPTRRLDVTVDKLRPVFSHGILGQAYMQEKRNGKVDTYPDSGEFTTSAMGEGAIDGNAKDYKVSSSYSTEFEYSLFDSNSELQGFYQTLVVRSGTEEYGDDDRSD
jgi:hypothetical protein